MVTHCYTVLVEKKNGGYRAHCPALPVSLSGWNDGRQP